ncbi:MAG: glucosaminidase domain-containing protein [Clostridium perfringens]|nr:glucosaminidase domain-containing protein [Clostridium perfringens]
MKDLLNLNNKEMKTILNEDIENISNVLVKNNCFDEDKIKKWAKRNNATELFLNLWDIYNNLYKLCGNVNPIIGYIQAAIATDFGNFNGDLKEDFNNPYGVKEFKYSDDGVLIEEYTKFKSWEDGVEAHLDHLALYVGAEGYPKDDSKDTRHFYYLYGICLNIADLQDKWTAKKDYSKRILDEIKNIFDDSNYRNTDDSLELENLKNENILIKNKLEKYEELIKNIKSIIETEIE